MKLSRVALLFTAGALCGVGLWGLQRTADFGFGDGTSSSGAKAEFYWSRLAYNSSMSSYGAFGRRGFWGFNSWSRDYPKADRQFLIAMHRLTRIDDRPYEQVVTLDNDDIFNYPWIYAVQVQNWSFTDCPGQALARVPPQGRLPHGGRLPRDAKTGELYERHARSSCPTAPSRTCRAAMKSSTPSTTSTPRCRFPASSTCGPAEPTRKTAIEPKWRAIRDDKGRIIVAICHNMHLGDAWEWADDPNYPETFASMAFRVGLDYIIYGMTHAPLGKFRLFKAAGSARA